MRCCRSGAVPAFLPDPLLGAIGPALPWWMTHASIDSVSRVDTAAHRVVRGGNPWRWNQGLRGPAGAAGATRLRDFARCNCSTRSGTPPVTPGVLNRVVAQLRKALGDHASIRATSRPCTRSVRFMCDPEVESRRHRPSRRKFQTACPRGNFGGARYGRGTWRGPVSLAARGGGGNAGRARGDRLVALRPAPGHVTYRGHDRASPVHDGRRQRRRCLVRRRPRRGVARRAGIGAGPQGGGADGPVGSAPKGRRARARAHARCPRRARRQRPPRWRPGAHQRAPQRYRHRLRVVEPQL